MHQAIQPAWYLEIGTQTGKSLHPASGNCIAVDPEFDLKHSVLDSKTRLFFFQETSDAFFASGFLDSIGQTLDLAFLDGMHLYEYLLRDFMNAERHMSADGCIVMHDCLPYEPSMAERDRKSALTRAWTGDVWKIVPFLQEFRPDLDISLFDSAPTGLVVVRGLDPANDTLRQNYDRIVRKYDEVEDVEAHVTRFDITPTQQSPWRLNRGGAGEDMRFVVQIPAPTAIE